MAEEVREVGEPPSRREISDAVGGLGWRYVLGVLRASVRVTSLSRAAEAAARLVRAAGDGADGRLWVDLRGDRLLLTLRSPAGTRVALPELELARRISEAARALGLRLDPEIAGPGASGVQLVEIAIDAIDIARIRPFWKAVMGYDDEAGASGPEDPLVDPAGQAPSIWFQSMTEPRPGRNRVHLDVSVPHDEALHRVRGALAAGGVLVSEARAPSFWVLADAEGNEVCVSTWQGRDRSGSP